MAVMFETPSVGSTVAGTTAMPCQGHPVKDAFRMSCDVARCTVRAVPNVHLTTKMNTM